MYCNNNLESLLPSGTSEGNSEGVHASVNKTKVTLSIIIPCNQEYNDTYM